MVTVFIWRAGRASHQARHGGDPGQASRSAIGLPLARQMSRFDFGLMRSRVDSDRRCTQTSVQVIVPSGNPGVSGWMMQNSLPLGSSGTASPFP
jgi:hypothetical protein